MDKESRTRAKGIGQLAMDKEGRTRAKGIGRYNGHGERG